MLIDACTELGIRPIICRQERVGVGIADGISRSTNGKNIGVFAMQGGPEVENAFAGAAQVFADNVSALSQAIEVTESHEPALIECGVKECYGFSRY